MELERAVQAFSQDRVSRREPLEPYAHVIDISQGPKRAYSKALISFLCAPLEAHAPRDALGGAALG